MVGSKRIVIINGSARRHGETADLVEQIAALLDDDGLTFDWLDLYAQDIKPCVGCNACIMRGEPCPRDDSAALLERIAGYDGLILASPVYVGSVTGQLKVLIDKACWWVHRPQLVGKPALVVSTTAGSKLGSVLRYLEYTVVEWGMQPAGRIGRSASRSGAVQQREVAHFRRLLRQERRDYRPKLSEVVSFEVKRVLIRFNPIDPAIWQELGWLDRPFYYDCRLGLHHRLVGWTIRTVLGLAIKPVDSSSA